MTYGVPEWRRPAGYSAGLNAGLMVPVSSFLTMPPIQNPVPMPQEPSRESKLSQREQL